MMPAQEVANQYQRHRARGASPVGLVVLLYDAAIDSLRRARQAAESGMTEDRVAASNHVLLVINELLRSLDRERGGEVAGNLDRFYAVARALLIEANVRSDPAMFEQLIGMFCSVREAWHRVEIEAAAPANVPDASVPAPSVGETSLVGWSA